MEMTALLSGLLGGICAWGATSLVAQPLSAFLTARGSAGRVLARYARYDRFNPTEDQPPEDIIRDRAKLLADTGADLIAFSWSNHCLSNILMRWVGWNAKASGENLLILAQMQPYGQSNDQLRCEIMKCLRLGKQFGPHVRI